MDKQRKNLHQGRPTDVDLAALLTSLFGTTHCDMKVAEAAWNAMYDAYESALGVADDKEAGTILDKEAHSIVCVLGNALRFCGQEESMPVWCFAIGQLYRHDKILAKLVVRDFASALPGYVDVVPAEHWQSVQGQVD